MRLTEDVIGTDYHRYQHYVEGTKGSIAVILSPEEFLLDETYQRLYSRAEITGFMLAGERYPIRYETTAPLSDLLSGGFEIINYCRKGRVYLISVRVLEKLQDNPFASVP